MATFPATPSCRTVEEESSDTLAHGEDVDEEGAAMTNPTRQSTSIWMCTATPTAPVLREDVEADVCVIGAGIAGLTTALLLGREGRSVVVLDQGRIGGGQTERTTAHLSNALDDRYVEIERLHGVEGSRLAAQSHTAAIDRIESIVADEGIDCDFQRLDGYLLFDESQPEDELARELDAAHRAGLADVQHMARATFGQIHSGPCLRFPRQAQFHPLRYLTGVANAVLRGGGRIFTDSHVDSISGREEDSPSTRERFPAKVVTSDGWVVRAGAVVVATNTPVNDLLAVHTKQAACRSYVIAARVRPGTVPKALFWDTMDPYHYVRLATIAADSTTGSPGYEMIVVGGEDHKTGQSDDAELRYDRLEAWARERFATMGVVEERWSGQVMETVDGLAFLGRNPLDVDNVYIATGDSGMGMTHGTIAGMLITDLILGRENPWATLYDPSRVTVGAAVRFAQEAANTAWQYTGWLTPGDVAAPGYLQPGEGAVLRDGLTKIAAYRDDHSMIHRMSAVCPHLGGIVTWNSSEHTWDCPCHGSRFDRYGAVLCGPAIGGLAPLDPDEVVGDSTGTIGG
jgi:glycine/D-amino acid oxidase-like deaminating enzyme/nitrite reductase/ring-hydroxylating ferredoxin subunit